jgi:hypothetical protein
VERAQRRAASPRHEEDTNIDSVGYELRRASIDVVG